MSERRVQVLNTPVSYSGGSGFKSRRANLILTEVFLGFPLPLGVCRGTTASFQIVFQFIIHISPYHSTRKVLETEKAW
jgi:hypothetical protein